MSKFPILSSKELLKVKPFSLVEEKVELSSGKQSTHFTLKHPGAVVVLPELRDGVYLFLREYRHSIGDFILELIAGTLSKDEAPELCAAREIQEEGGYKAQNLIPIGTIYPAPGFCDEIQYLYFAKGLSKSSLPQDDDEIIEVVEMSTSDILSAIDSGKLKDGKSLACLMLAARKGLIELF